MSGDQNTKTIKEFQKSVEDARKCIEDIPFDLEKSEAKLNEVRFSVNNFFDSFIKIHHGVEDVNINNPIPLAVHYTSIGTLVSMLQYVAENKEHVTNNNNHVNNRKNNILRAYDSMHFNDPNEGKFFTQSLPEKYKSLLENEHHHAYISSFIRSSSQDKNGDRADDLIFWRTYGKDGEGCSLSLMVDSSCIQKVVYGHQKISKNIKELKPILDEFLVLKRLIKTAPSPSRSMLQIHLESIILDSMEKIRYLYKSDAYGYENECRFIHTQLATSKIDEIHFECINQNNGSVNVRHYYEHENLKIEKLLITGSLITLGPCVPYHDSVKYYITALLERAKLYGPTVKLSKVSYRKP